MPHLAISLLGTLRVTIDQRAVQTFPTTKAQALLAYLVVEQNRAHERSALAALLWPDQEPDLARNNLRQTLFRLRKALGDKKQAVPFLLLTRTTVQFNVACQHWLDVAEFTTAVRSPQNILQLRQAFTLFEGDFLEQITLGDSAEFEEWATVQRQWYRQKLLDAAHRVGEHYLAMGQPEAAQEFAWRQVTLEPLREEGHRQVMAVLAGRGQRSAAVAQYERCVSLLANELGVPPAPETESLYRQILSGTWLLAPSTPRARPVSAPLIDHQPRAHPPIAAQAQESEQEQEQENGAGRSATLFPTAVVRHQPLPLLMPLVGYDEEQKQLPELLARADCRLLTVTGLPGVGKTALARQVARMWDGPAAWVEMGTLAPEGVADTAVLQFLQAQIANWPEQSGLLLLDGFDRWRSYTAVLTQLQQEAPHLTLLITACRPLNVPGEWIFDVVGLAYPENLLTDEWLTFPSVQFFWQTAQRVNSDLYLTEEDWQAMAEIVRLLEGHPLGIEWAAHWTRLLPCPEIAAQLRDNLHFLTAADEQRDLLTLFATLWAELPTAVQKALQRLTIFPAGFNRQAAAEVAEVPPPLLLRLLNESLVRRVTPDFYQMPAILRHFVRKQVGTEPATAVRARFVSFYIEEVQVRQSAALGGAGNQQERVLAGLRREWANIVQAWRWLGSAPLPPVWPTAVEMFTRLCEKLGEQKAGAELLTAVRAQRPAAEQPIWQLAQGWLWHLEGKMAPAREMVQGAVARLASDPHTKPPVALRAHTLMARLFLASGETVAAEAHCRPALALCQQERDEAGAALALLVGAQLAWQQGQHGRASHLAHQSQALWQRRHNRWRQAETLLLLAELAHAQDDLPLAQQQLLTALKLWQGMQAHSQMLLCWQRLGQLARQQKQLTAARQWYETLYTAAQATRRPQEAVAACRALGLLAREEQAYPTAQLVYQQGIQVAWRHQLRPQMAVLLVELAELWGEARWLGVAQPAMQAALSPDAERLVHHFFGQLEVAEVDGRQVTGLATAVVQAFLGPEERPSHLDEWLQELQL